MPNLRTERKTGAALPSPFSSRSTARAASRSASSFANTARHIDDICVIRSMHADVPNHEPSLMLMNCGDARLIRPSMGSWVTYGLGSENQNLPGFIAMCPGGYPIQETQNWQSAFLPGVYQGTYIDTRHTDLEKLIENIRNDSRRRARSSASSSTCCSSSTSGICEQRAAATPSSKRASSRSSWPTACRRTPTDAFDVSREPQHIRDMYGPGVQARQLLIARRLLERGVRFVQVWHGDGQPWDNHDDIEVNHRRLARRVRPGHRAPCCTT